MNRAMFSGVAGLKTHMTRLDVIGNNIANCNTYGYKTQRAVFSDIFYQTLSAASAGTSIKGGTNASDVGFGSTVEAVQCLITQSSLQQTGFSLDVAIAGEGFLQVQDQGGNIYYTKAGMLSYDSNGYLVDVNGSFVLGTTDVNGEPDHQKINIAQAAGAVEPKPGSFETVVNDRKITVTASNNDRKSNIGMSFGTDKSLPVGQAAIAILTSSSAEIRLNPRHVFRSIDDLNEAINDAILNANGGIPHPGGTFTISIEEMDAGKAPEWPLTGAELAGINFGYVKGDIELPSEGIYGGFKIVEVGDEFSSVISGQPGVNYNEKLSFYMERVGTRAKSKTGQDDEERFLLAVTDGQKVWKQIIPASQMDTAGTVLLQNNGSNTDTITMSFPSYNKVVTDEKTSPFQNGLPLSYKQAVDPKESFTQTQMSAGDLLGGVKITSGDMTNAIIGVTVSYTPDPKAGTATANWKDNKWTIAFDAIDKENNKIQFGTDDGKGGTVGNPITFTAKDAGTTVNIETTDKGGKKYSFAVKLPSLATLYSYGQGESAAGVPFVITESDSDIASLAQYATYNIDPQGTAPATPTAKTNLSNVFGIATPAGKDALTDFVYTNFAAQPGYDVTDSYPSKDLGLGAKNFLLAGGTDGGIVTLDELTSIAIGTDGIISCYHEELGLLEVGRINLATFVNPQGLEASGNNYFKVTPNSGPAILTVAGTDGTGIIKSSTLEMSNVDLSEEFTGMITTQRGYQANARVITVTDTMLEELINLKR